MYKLTELSLEALDRYFHTLSVLGYMNYDNVYRLLALLFIEEILTRELSSYINEEDYKYITEFLYCLYGSNCMIDFPSYKSFDKLIHSTKSPFTPRLSESQIIRVSEGTLIRKV